jgi:serine/threonine protein kinase
VVLKEARPHVATNSTGKDVRDLLRAEARALTRLGPLGLAPRLVQLFEQGRHVFLAQELVPGAPLRQWVVDEMRHGEWRLPVPAALEMAGRVVELMAQAHQAGVILRDFNPANIMVQPDGTLQLIDLELAVEVGEPSAVAIAAGTPGFSAPEQMAGASPAIEADYYSLGTTLEGTPRCRGLLSTNRPSVK